MQKTLPISLLSLLFILSAGQTLFPTTPNVNIYTGTPGPQVVSACLQSGLIYIGYQGGIIKIYDFSGNVRNTISTGSNAAIMQIQPFYINPTFGTFAYVLDNNNTLSGWLGNGSLFSKVTYNQTAYDFAITVPAVQTLFYSINLGTSLTDYTWNLTQSGLPVQVNTYPPASGTAITTIQYSADSKFLFAGSNTSYVYFYNASNDNLLSYSFSTGSKVLKFTQLNSGVMALMTSNYSIYKFTYPNFSNSLIGQTTQTTAFTGCPSGLIVTGQNGSNHLIVFNSNGNKIQTLSYPTASVVSVICTGDYLISIDASGYLAINQLPSSNDKLQGWIIGVIAGVSGIVLILIIVIVIYFIKKKKKRAMLELNNSTAKEMLVSPEV